WEKGQGELTEQVGDPDDVNEELFVPTYSYFVDSKNFIKQTEYDTPTGQWFMNSEEGKLGYGLSSGTMEVGEDYVVKLFGHDQDGVQMDRDVRIQLTKRDQKFEQSELIMEDIIHVDTIANEEEIYSNQLPDKENVVYM